MVAVVDLIDDVRKQRADCRDRVLDAARGAGGVHDEGAFAVRGGDASDAARDGTVLLDFNLATNPYCAYTAYATCPLPPAQNRLPVRIEAGERQFPQSGEAGAHA